VQDSEAEGREQSKGEKKSPNFPSHPVNFAEFAAWIEQERGEDEPEGTTQIQPSEG
jgi:hypothetical protein